MARVPASPRPLPAADGSSTIETTRHSIAPGTSTKIGAPVVPLLKDWPLSVLTADDGKGNIAAATVNWVTQTAFAPPLVVVGVKTDSGTYQTVDGRPRVRAQNTFLPWLHPA
jgi:Flavin reductase like domain